MRLYVWGVAAAIVLAGCATGTVAGADDDTNVLAGEFHVHGHFDVDEEGTCHPDASEQSAPALGDSVVVTDDDGDQVGESAYEAAELRANSLCVYTFTVEVPVLDTYHVRLGGPQPFARQVRHDHLVEADWQVCFSWSPHTDCADHSEFVPATPFD